MIKTALILSAGAGQRLRPLTLLRPKPLFPVLNKTMLEWWAEFLASAGLRRMVVNVHYQAPLMLERVEQLAACFAGKLEIVPSPEEEVLGTGGALKKAAPLLGKGDFLVINADIFTDFELVKLSLKHLANPGRLATMGLLDQKQPANVSVGEGGRLLAFREAEPVPGELRRLTYCGVMAVSPAVFDLIPEGASDIIEVFRQALPNNAEIYGWLYDPAIWRDMGTPVDYWNLNRDLAAGRTIIHSTAKVEGRLHGWNVIAGQARIEENASVENCVVWPSAVVSAGAVVRNAVICGVVPPQSVLDGGVFCDAPAS